MIPYHPRFRLAAVLLIATAVLVWPAENGYSASAARPASGLLQLEGPFPIRHWVRLFVDKVQFFGKGDRFSSSEVTLRFALAVDNCDGWEGTIVDGPLRVQSAKADDRFISSTSVLRPVFPTEYTCTEAEVHNATRSYGGIDHGDSRDLDVLLPGGQEMYRVSRYAGNVVSAAMSGREQDVQRDDDMGGAYAHFSYRRNFGTDGDLGRAHPFDTCAPGRDDLCFSSSLHLSVVPEPKAKDRNLEVIEVYGPDECVGGRRQDWAVSLRNPEDEESQPYAATIGLLDPEFEWITRQWYSGGHPGIPPFGSSFNIVVPDVRVPPGQHRLMVAGGMHMATAVEVTISCRLDLNVDVPPIELVPTPAPRPLRGLP